MHAVCPELRAPLSHAAVDAIVVHHNNHIIYSMMPIKYFYDYMSPTCAQIVGLERHAQPVQYMCVPPRVNLASSNACHCSIMNTTTRNIWVAKRPFQVELEYKHADSAFRLQAGIPLGNAGQCDTHGSSQNHNQAAAQTSHTYGAGRIDAMYNSCT